jgi:3-phenylpropionate/trans-cinnamate dioxygenase ferredoxin reductase component
MDAYKYVIIGGGLTGGSAAEAIREVDSEGSLVLVTQEPHRPYHRPPLSKSYLQGKRELERVFLKDEAYYQEQSIELRTATRALAVDPATRTVTLQGGQALSYERLLLATGGRAWRLPLPGNDLDNVFTLRTIDDSQRIQQAGGDGRRALILGGSFIGSEVTMSLVQLGTEVTMAFPEARLMARLAAPEFSDLIEGMYRERGVRILTDTTAERLEGEGQVARAVLDSGETLDVDLVVMGVGIRLNTGLAQEAGLALGKDEAILVDEHLRTSDPNIYAAGDIAAWPDQTFGRRLRVEHWDVAYNQGKRVGRNMAGDEEPYTVLPYFFSDLFDLALEVWGDLDSWDRTVLRGSLEAGSYAFYYFDQGKLTGVLAVGLPDEEREPLQALIKERVAYDRVADKLRDEEADLQSLLK